MANLHGSCLCGTVKYEIQGDPMMVAYCHCSRCQKFTGAAAEPAMLVPADLVKVTAGQDNLTRFEPEGFVHREFCKTCGSSLFSHLTLPAGAVTVVTLGTIDGDPGVRPMMHIHVASKAPWDEIADDLPQIAEVPSM